MKVEVWDTYIQCTDGKKMHFDIVVPENVKDSKIIYQYGYEYLKKQRCKILYTYIKRM
jgi:hypothetical protein